MASNDFDPTAMGLDAMASRVRPIEKPLSYMRPTAPDGSPYTLSYTRYVNSPGSSYVHPMFPLFNDRRPQTPAIRTTLNTPGRQPGM